MNAAVTIPDVLVKVWFLEFNCLNCEVILSHIQQTMTSFSLVGDKLSVGQISFL
jgi:hypothetical protein